MSRDLRLDELLRRQYEQVVRRVRGAAGYDIEIAEHQRAAALVDELRDRLGLGEFVRGLNVDTGKPQLLLEFRDAVGAPVVLKVYGRRRPNEAAVQRLWGDAGVACPRVLASGDDPVSWLLMTWLPGWVPASPEGPGLTAPVARLMRIAHRLHHPDVGEARDLHQGIGIHLRTVLAAAQRHGYPVPAEADTVAAEVLSVGWPTFLHGDLAPVNLLRDDSHVCILDTCGYTGPSEFDAARWSARVGGAARHAEVLRCWLQIEDSLDPELANRLLGWELLMEAGVREIVKEEQGRAWIERDPETLALIAAGRRLVACR